ncbi:DUF3263 domain-containing protein [Micromonospora sp. HK10]|uniref:DUF3263 domain-containing protein n=1 Tax=Micromonospora sp. HK10 TaxID=1538294 RepID=UPI000627331E|nr:DUF3263 domain-containing protein [Micromonospora sp. HK10]KKJ93382.1 hypothetical protein LQ51_30265 [Micromonospora sp. HK10]
MPADASPAATDRPEPSGSAAVARRDAGATVPPPRSAPAVEAAPVAEADAAPAPAAPDAEAVAAPAPAAPDAEAVAAPAPVAAPATGSVQTGRTDRDAAPAATGDLTERERRILAFEQQWWKHAGAKEQAIRDTFGLSATRYYQLLNGLLDHPAALAAEPVLIGRLRRLRSSRARNRRR